LSCLRNWNRSTQSRLQRYTFHSGSFSRPCKMLKNRCSSLVARGSHRRTSIEWTRDRCSACMFWSLARLRSGPKLVLLENPFPTFKINKTDVNFCKNTWPFMFLQRKIEASLAKADLLLRVVERLSLMRTQDF
jgi:hypothetical protein